MSAILHMNRLTIFGLTAVSLMLLFYSLEDRSPMFLLAFAVACAMGSAYGFLVPAAWPFGVVEGVWSLVALRRWFRSRTEKSRPLSVEEIL